MFVLCFFYHFNLNEDSYGVCSDEEFEEIMKSTRVEKRGLNNTRNNLTMKNILIHMMRVKVRGLRCMLILVKSLMRRLVMLNHLLVERI